MVDGVTAQG